MTQTLKNTPPPSDPARTGRFVIWILLGVIIATFIIWNVASWGMELLDIR